MKFKCISDAPNTNEMKMLTVGKVYEGNYSDTSLRKSWIFIRECDDGISGEFQSKHFEVVDQS